MFLVKTSQPPQEMNYAAAALVWRVTSQDLLSLWAANVFPIVEQEQEMGTAKITNSFDSQPLDLMSCAVWQSQNELGF